MSLTLHQRQQIDREKEGLVTAAEKVLEEGRVVAIDPNKFGHSQLRNLIAVALKTDSPAVVENFIRYQMGRDPHGNSWSNKVGSKALGQRFLDELGSGGAIGEALGRIDRGGDPLADQLVKVELIRHFLGFAARYLKYVDLGREKKSKGKGGGT